MADPWIKMRHNLPSDPDVLRIAEIAGVDRHAVVGRLLDIWSWADAHSVSGDAVSVTTSFLDRRVECDGFCAAMRKVGWLDGRDWDLTFPNFDRHNGESAKKRAQTHKRTKRYRDADSVTKSSPDKRRVDKRRNTHTHTHSVGKANAEIPDHMQSDGFPDAWSRWLGWIESTQPRPVDPIRQESLLMELGRRGPAKAARDIDFSIQKNSGNILDSDNDFQKSRGKSKHSDQELRF